MKRRYRKENVSAQAVIFCWWCCYLLIKQLIWKKIWKKKNTQKKKDHFFLTFKITLMRQFSELLREIDLYYFDVVRFEWKKKQVINTKKKKT